MLASTVQFSRYGRFRRLIRRALRPAEAYVRAWRPGKEGKSSRPFRTQQRAAAGSRPDSCSTPRYSKAERLY
jgi:hypothetical protein